MNPGRELNELIGVAVMKWTVAVCAAEGDARLWVTGRPPGPIDPTRPFSRPAIPFSLWRPSTDIAAAWEVVEKVGLTVGPYGKIGWHAGIRQDGDLDMWDVLVPAQTAPHAICLAALKAVGK